MDQIIPVTQDREADQYAHMILTNPLTTYPVPEHLKGYDVVKDALSALARLRRDNMYKLAFESAQKQLKALTGKEDVTNVAAAEVVAGHEDLNASDKFFVTINPSPTIVCDQQARKSFWDVVVKYAQRKFVKTVRITPETRSDDGSISGMHVHMLLETRKVEFKSQLRTWTLNTFKKYIGHDKHVNIKAVHSEKYLQSLEKYITYPEDQEKHSDDPLLRQELGVTKGFVPTGEDLT